MPLRLVIGRWSLERRDGSREMTGERASPGRSIRSECASDAIIRQHKASRIICASVHAIAVAFGLPFENGVQPAS